MKYMENESSKTEYKKKEIQGNKPIVCTLTPYKEEHGGSLSWWERKKRPTMDEGQRNRCAERKKKNPKNTETDRKVIHQNTKTNTGMEEVGEEEKGRGTLGLEISSKLLEPGAKWTWGGGMEEAIPPLLQLWHSGGVAAD
jgi:hypothetical protein